VQLHRKLRTIFHWWGSWYAVADALGVTQVAVADWLRCKSYPGGWHQNKIDAEYLICMERLRRYHKKSSKVPWLVEDTVTTMEWEENLALLEQQAEVWLLKNSLTGLLSPDTIPADEEKPREGAVRATVLNQSKGPQTGAEGVPGAPEGGEGPEDCELKGSSDDPSKKIPTGTD